jgi:hypothetical protein
MDDVRNQAPPRIVPCSDGPDRRRVSAAFFGVAAICRVESMLTGLYDGSLPVSVLAVLCALFLAEQEDAEAVSIEHECR